MPEEFSLKNIDELIELWRSECLDLHPSNVDSMDRGPELNEHVAYRAICLVPALLEELKSYMIREQEGHETETSRIAHKESRKWLEKLTEWLS